MLARQSSPLAHWQRSARAAVGAAIAAIAVILTFALRMPDYGSRFLLAYPAVLGASYFAGRYAGYSATFVAGVLFTIAQLMVWRGRANDWAQLATLVVFLGIGFGAAVVLSRLKSANRETELANVELERSRDEARAAHDQTDLLLRELRHRVKNDIANAVSLLQLQANASPDPAQTHLLTAAARLQVLAKVHERLARQGHNPVVDLGDFLESLCRDLRTTTFAVRPVSLETSFEPFQVPSSEAVAVGLIVNELITNAVKYGFGENSGSINATVERDGDQIEVAVWDNGRGFDPKTTSGGLGHRLVHSLTAQLRGEFTCDSGEGGTTCRVRYRSAEA